MPQLLSSVSEASWLCPDRISALHVRKEFGIVVKEDGWCPACKELWKVKEKESRNEKEQRKVKEDGSFGLNIREGVD